MNMTLPAGTYTVKSSAVATFANSGSNNVGFVSVKGCAGSSQPLDAGAGDTLGGMASCNLIVNGNAEAAVGSLDGTPVATPGWTSVGEAWRHLLEGWTPVRSETGTLCANVPSLQGGNPSWRHCVSLAGGNILLAIDYYGGPTGLPEITPVGTDTAWTLAQGPFGHG